MAVRIPAFSLLLITLLTRLSIDCAFGDEIVKFNGRRIGKVTIESANNVEVNYKRQEIATPQRLPAEEVRRVIYTDSSLESAYAYLEGGSWGQALGAFRKDKMTAKLTEPAEYGTAYTFYRRYMTTGENRDQAVSALKEYIEKYTPKKGFHVPFAHYALGRALIAGEKLDDAGEQFDTLADFPGQSRELLAELGRGELALAGGNAQDAATTFNIVLRQAETGELDTIYRNAVAFRGRALVAEGRIPDAIRFLENYIDARKGENIVFDRYTAQAYNALADAYAARGGEEARWKALYCYLRTTALFGNAIKECAEAFFKASRHAQALNLAQDAKRLEDKLLANYGNTVWAKKKQ